MTSVSSRRRADVSRCSGRPFDRPGPSGTVRYPGRRGFRVGPSGPVGSRVSAPCGRAGVCRIQHVCGPGLAAGPRSGLCGEPAHVGRGRPGGRVSERLCGYRPLSRKRRIRPPGRRAARGELAGRVEAVLRPRAGAAPAGVRALAVSAIRQRDRESPRRQFDNDNSIRMRGWLSPSERPGTPVPKDVIYTHITSWRCTRRPHSRPSPQPL